MSQLSLPAPIPILAVWADPVLTVTFDQPLFARPLNPSNWVLRLADLRYIALAANSVGSAVVVNAIDDEMEPGLDGISYAAIPDDLTGLDGTPVPAFNDFPIS